MMKNPRVLRAKVPTPRFLSAGVHTFEVWAYSERSIDEIADDLPEINRTLSRSKVKKKTGEIYHNIVFELGVNPVGLDEFCKYFRDTERKINCKIVLQRIDFAFDFSMSLGKGLKYYLFIMEATAKYLNVPGIYKTIKPDNTPGNLKIMKGNESVTLYDCSDKRNRCGNARFEYRYTCRVNKNENVKRIFIVINELRELMRCIPQFIVEVEIENKSDLKSVLQEEQFTSFSDFVTEYKHQIITKDVLKFLHSTSKSGNFNKWLKGYQSTRKKILFSNTGCVARLLYQMYEETLRQSRFITKKLKS